MEVWVGALVVKYDKKIAVSDLFPRLEMLALQTL